MPEATDLLIEHRDVQGADESEIQDTCTMYGNMYELMDSIFSILHTARGGVNEELLQGLEIKLELARRYSKNLGMNETPKWHVLLCHAVSYLRESGGRLFQKG